MEHINLQSLRTDILRLEAHVEEQNTMLRTILEIFVRKGFREEQSEESVENEIKSAGDISLEMAAKLFGCSTRHVSRLAKRFGFKHYKDGKYTRYHLFPLLAIIKQHNLKHNEIIREKIDANRDFDKIVLNTLSLPIL